MSTLNTLKGHFVKDYSVKYKEKLSNGLWFYVIFKYDSGYKSKEFYRSSSELYIETIITDGNLNSWSNNVLSYKEATIHEDILKSESFLPLAEEIRTKDGYRVWQEVYNKVEYTQELEKGKTEKRKSRVTKWLVEVPKEDLLKICLR